MERQRDLLNEMRSLLKQYPFPINLKGIHDTEDLINGLVFVYDILIYCREKTTQEEIRKKIEAEIKLLDDSVDVQKVRGLCLQMNDETIYGRHWLKKEAFKLISRNFKAVTESIQYFSLAIPFKEKTDLHLRTAHGIPANMAEDIMKDIEEEPEFEKKAEEPKEGSLIPA